jgi:hypothetical protein
MSHRSGLPGPEWQALHQASVDDDPKGQGNAQLETHARLAEDPLHEAETDRRAALTAELRRFALKELAGISDQLRVELVGVDGYRDIRRADALAPHEALKGVGVSENGGIDGRLAAVDENGVIREGDPFGPGYPTLEAVAVLSPPVTQFLYRITPNFPLETILPNHLSLVEGYSGKPAPCEFSTAVSGGVGGAACTTCDNPQPSCCDGRAAGWALDYWKQKNVVLAWRACAPCLRSVAYWRANSPAHDGPQNVSEAQARQTQEWAKDRREREFTMGERLAQDRCNRIRIDPEETDD